MYNITKSFVSHITAKLSGHQRLVTLMLIFLFCGYRKYKQIYVVALVEFMSICQQLLRGFG
jgi:hypothetical protein